MLNPRVMLRSAAVPLVITSIGAIVAALLKQWIAVLAHHPWGWKEFFQDLIQNAFIAVVVSFLVATVQARQLAQRLRDTQGEYVLGRLEAMALVISGWNEVPGAQPESVADLETAQPDALVALNEAAKRWREAAASLETIYEAQPEELVPGKFETRAETNLRLAFAVSSVARSSFNEYLLEGSRKRRLVWVGYLESDLAVIESAVDEDLARAAHAARKKAVALSSWVQHTDTTIIQRLVIAPSSQIFGTRDSTMRMRRLERVYSSRLNDVAVSSDCVNLLFFHIEQVEQYMSGTDYASEDVIDDLVVSVRRPLGALRNELRAAAELAEALVALVTRARSVSTQPG